MIIKSRDPIDIYKTPTTVTKYMFFFKYPQTYTKKDHILGHKTSLNKREK